MHDAALREFMCLLLTISADTLQAPACKLLNTPLRFGGMGFRSAVRTAPAAYWAAWADTVQSLAARFGAAHPVVHRLTHKLENGSPEPCICAARAAASYLETCEFSRPSWLELAARAHIVDPVGDDETAEEPDLGEWRRGWQFLACDAVERFAFRQLYETLSLCDRALLRSQSGPAASVWLVTFPCVFQFRPTRFVNSLLRRLFLRRVGPNALSGGTELR